LPRNQALLHSPLKSPFDGARPSELPSSRAAPLRQTKIPIGHRDDVFEREADATADRVMRTSIPAVKAAAEGTQLAKAVSSPTNNFAPPIVHDVLRSPGQPLDAATRAFFEPRLGHNFSKVRVHWDEQAAESAKAVQARAYTVGRDVVFGAGEFAPGSEAGQRLLGHELTHTIQQSRSRSGTALQRQTSGGPPKPLEPLEAIAQRIARLALGPNQAKVQPYLGSPRGPVLSVVRNKNTGAISVGLNTGIPEKLTEVIKREIDAQKARISKGQIRVIHNVAPGEHAEINALNSAIAQEQIRIKRELKAEELGIFELHNVWLKEGKQLETAPRCEHCAAISERVSVTESILWAESGGSVAPSGGRAQPVKTTASGKITSPQRGPQITPGGPAEPAKSVKGEPPSGQARPSPPTEEAPTSPREIEPTIHEKTTEAESKPTIFEGAPDVELPHEGGLSAKGEAVGGGVVIAAQLKDWIMGILGDRKQSQRVNAALERKSKYIRSVQQEHPEFGVLITVYWRVSRGNEGEESRRFEDVSIRTGRTKREALEAPEGALDVTASDRDRQTNETWIAPLKPVSLIEYPTPYKKIAIATFAEWHWPVLQDVSGAFNKKGKTKLDLPQVAHPRFAILSPPTWIFVQGYGRVDIETRSEPSSDGYAVPVISDLHAALVFPLDAMTAKLLSQGPRIKDTTGQLQGNFDLMRWVPVEDIQIESAISKEVSQTQEGKLWDAFRRETSSRVLQHPFTSVSGGPRSETQEDVLRFSKSGKNVTLDSLVAWARESYPRGLNDPRLLKNIYTSHEFSGSDSAREAAAVALVLRLREEASKARPAK
jgi:hypothetical protein